MAAGLLVCALATTGCNGDKTTVAQKGKTDECPKDISSEVVRSCTVVTIDVTNFLRVGDKVQLTLPGGQTVEISPVETQPFEGGGIVWHGVIAGKKFSDVTISTVGNAVVGTIAFDGHMYRMRTLSDDVRIIEELDPTKFPTDIPPETEPAGAAEFEPPAFTCDPGTDDCQPVAAQCNDDDPNQIDVLVIYTQKAANALLGEAALNAWIILQVFEANRSYELSKLTHQIRLVAVIPTNYQETSNYWSLTDLIDNGDPNLDAHASRNDHHADVVVLLTQAASAGGAGYSKTFIAENVPDNDFVPFEPFAYAVVDALGFETPEFVFAHEIGHLMGAEHDSSASPAEGVIAGQSRGFIDPSPGASCTGFMTIMAVRNSATPQDPGYCPSCDRLAMWSNTDTETMHCQQPVGSATAQNRDALKLTAPFIAKFRCGLLSPKNVWMKDTWNDSGAEPDPSQAGADMWKSPYIWVRNQQDDKPSFPAQHLHQNAIPGQVNYVYAKLQNDGALAVGDLEIWAAESATALQWPANFHKVGSAGVPNFPPNSTRIVEVPWTPNGNGPFSLVAKWVSASDPSPSPEPVDPDTFARNSNNVVWRSLNVVTLDPATDEASSTLIVRNPEDGGSYGRLVLRPSDANPRHSFLRYGTVIVQLDAGLMKAWERNGYRGSGFERAGNQLRITEPEGAILDGLTLDGRVENRMRIVFRLPREGRKQGKYHLDVIQTSAAEIEARRLGGTSFEIQVTTKR